VFVFLVSRVWYRLSYLVGGCSFVVEMEKVLSAGGMYAQARFGLWKKMVAGVGEQEVRKSSRS